MSDNDETKPEQPESEDGEGAIVSCPSCGTEIPDDAPGGICPKCALVEAASPAEEHTLPMTGPQFEPPALETLAEAFPHLEIIELIGCGGMGAVYKARQPNLDRLVALKILPPSLAESPAFTERFSREGRLLAKLSHPNIVGIHDFGEGGGFFFLLMEYVDGVNLRQAMRAGRFTPEQAMGVVPEVCEALQFAHDEGVLHRDIKPENILLDAKGRVKIADFGIAKLIGEGAADDFTLTGTSMPGTPQYMAPEQIEHPEDVDHRADIFSLGVVFYEMLTGELPMGRFSAPSEKTAVDSQIDEIVFRSLEKERDRRQQSADQVRTEIEGIPVEAISKMRHPGYEIPAGEKTPDMASGGGRAAWIVATGFILLIVFYFVVLIERNQSLVQTARDQGEARKADVEALIRMSRYNAEVKELQSKIRQNPVSPGAEDARKKLDDLRDELKQNPIQRTVEVQTVVHATPIGPVVFIGLLLFSACIPGTIMGWKSLRRIRALGLKDGRGAALFAALFWPLLFLSALFLGFIGLMLYLAPTWIAVLISLFALPLWGAAVGFSIWWTRRWLKSPPTESERTRALEDLSRPKNPWVRRIAWLLVILLISPLLLLLVARTGFVPGFFELVIVGGIATGFIILIVTLLRKKRSTETVARTAVQSPPLNPWPRRVFWLIVVIFILPPAITLLGLVIPYFAARSEGPQSHTVEIQNLEQVENVVRFNIYSELKGDKDIVFQFHYQGPSFPFETHQSGKPLVPGDGTEWRLNQQSRTHYERIELGFPDKRLANRAAQWIQSTMKPSGRGTWDLRQILFFDMTASEGGSWQAYLEVDSNPAPMAEKIE